MQSDRKERESGRVEGKQQPSLRTYLFINAIYGDIVNMIETEQGAVSSGRSAVYHHLLIFIVFVF